MSSYASSGKFAKDTRSDQFGASKPSAVEEHDPVVLGQAERQIERMDILLQVLDGFLSDVLARPEFEIDEGVIAVEVWVWTKLKAHARL